MPREVNNTGVRHGVWGENVAAEFLRRNGYDILDRNCRPVASDQRLEIDIVARERQSDTIVFVEVKQHEDFSPYSRRLRSITKRKRLNLRRAFVNWRLKHHWFGAYRFDVIEIYGVPEGGAPIIDHIDRVHIFKEKERFVKW